MIRLSIIILILAVLTGCSEEKKESIDNSNLLTVDSSRNSVNYRVKLDSNANISVIDNKDGTTENGVLVDGKKNGVWKKFSSDKSLENVGYYYNDSLLYILDKSDYLFANFKLDAHANISYPKSWIVNEGQPDVLVSFIKKHESAMMFAPMINIQSDSLSKTSSFPDYVNKEIETLKKNPTFKLIKLREYSIEDLNTVQAVYIVFLNKIKLGVVTNWVRKGNKIYILNAMASNEKKGDFLRYKELFQDILFTLNICN